jgi:hypothetical protein
LKTRRLVGALILITGLLLLNNVIKLFPEEKPPYVSPDVVDCFPKQGSALDYSPEKVWILLKNKGWLQVYANIDNDVYNLDPIPSKFTLETQYFENYMTKIKPLSQGKHTIVFRGVAVNGYTFYTDPLTFTVGKAEESPFNLSRQQLLSILLIIIGAVMLLKK